MTRMPRPAAPAPLPSPAGGTWDVLVIGGGVHGAAIARDAAMRGLSVMLVEKTDFGAGTSSRSSKLAHGGLRYLEHFEVALVRESLHERDALLYVAPHLAWPLPFLIPLSGPRPRAGWKVRIGLSLYDLLAGSSSLGRHDVIDEAEAIRMAPGLDGCGMRQAARYYDAGMDDARIVVELVVDAVSLGAACVNHAKATKLLREGETVIGAMIQRDGFRAVPVRARTTVMSAGAWTDALTPRRDDGSKRLALTKGVHLFVRRPLVKDAALMLAAPRDGRIFFVIPWKGGSLIGTTDTAFGQAADRARASRTDVRYLLSAVNETLPAAQLEASDVVAVQSGLRPLIAPDDPEDPSSMSRDYRLDLGVDGLVIVEGGKYTIFRRLAERVVDHAVAVAKEENPRRRLKPCGTATRMLPGGVSDFAEIEHVELRAVSRKAPRESAKRIVARYGMRARHVIEEADGDKALLRPACDEHPHLLVEALHAVREELAMTPADALLRRLDLGWWDCGGLRCRAAWASALSRVLPRDAVRAGLDACEEELARDWRAPLE